MKALIFLTILCVVKPSLAAVGSYDFNEVESIPSSAPVVLIINVGQGNCQLIMCAGRNEAVLVDCGTTAAPDNRDERPDVKARITQKIRELIGNRRLYIALSHTDSDHINLLDGILFDESGGLDLVNNINAIFLGGFPSGVDVDKKTVGNYFRTSAASKLKRYLESEAGKVKVKVNDSDFFTRSCSGVTMTILSNNHNIANPTSSSPVNNNQGSLVLEVNFTHIDIILPGDAIGSTELDAVNSLGRQIVGDIKILLMSHHGSNTNGSNTYLPKSYKPDLIIASGKPTGGHKFPRSEAVQRVLLQEGSRFKFKSYNITTRGSEQSIGENNTPVLGTGNQGSIYIYCDRKGYVQVKCIDGNCPEYKDSIPPPKCNNKRRRTRSQTLSGSP